MDYVLAGTVLWAGERVRITPQLIRVADDTQLWARQYDRDFDVESLLATQSEIAKNVSLELDLSLRAPAESARAPANLDAYRAYLRGLEAVERPGYREENYRVAVEMFQRAVDLDPGFALAWGRLSESHHYYYLLGYDRSPERLAAAGEAVERARELAPDLPETHRALGRHLVDLDKDSAYRELEIAFAGLPNDSSILAAMADILERRGDPEGALELFERAVLLDPRSSDRHFTLAGLLTRLRQYERAARVYEQALALAPDNSEVRVKQLWNTALWRGFEAANEVRQGDARRYDHWLLDWISGRYDEALASIERWWTAGDSAERVSGRVTYSYYPEDMSRALVLTAMGRERRAAASWESARIALEAALRERPEDDQIWSSLGVVYAGLGRKAEAIRHGKRGLELRPPARDAAEGPSRLWDLARIYAMVGERDAALDTLDRLLSIPALFSVRVLEAEPTFAPLRDHPRYERLVQKYQ